MASELSKNAEKIQAILNRSGYGMQVVEMADSTRTAQEAADAIGCAIGQIAKSLVFKGKTSQKPVMVVASGSNRVNEKIVKELIGEKPEKADAEYVLEQTGYVIGGIPPVGHKKEITVLIDEDLMQYSEIWAAAGTPHAVFKLTPQILCEITAGKVIRIH
ncbi:MAG: YbaK/EbsC family protein [Clostridiaceae bacterium]|nr:YbaK/EbsC family protein [Clostridiaceae bacterium]